MFGVTDNDIILHLWNVISEEFQNIIYSSNMAKAVCSLPILNFQAMNHTLKSWLTISKKLDILGYVFYMYLRIFSPSLKFQA